MTNDARQTCCYVISGFGLKHPAASFLSPAPSPLNPWLWGTAAAMSGGAGQPGGETHVGRRGLQSDSQWEAGRLTAGVGELGVGPAFSGCSLMRALNLQPQR